MILGAQASNETFRNVRACLLKTDYWFNLVMFEAGSLTLLEKKIYIQKRLSKMIKPGTAHASNTFKTRWRCEVRDILFYHKFIAYTAKVIQ